MAASRVIVIGASSGGIEALTQVAAGLPADLPAAVFVVQHVAPDSKNYLAKALSAHSAIAAKTAEHGDRVEDGQLMVAHSDRHLLLDTDRVTLSRGPRENRSRPAIDPLFRSAALAFGPRTIGVVLSGSLDDGTAGLQAIKQCGGIAVAQDPDDAITPDMPQSAIDNVDVDHIAPATEIAALLVRLIHEAEPEEPEEALAPEIRRGLEREVAILRNESGDIETAVQLGDLASFSCPDCGGPLWEMRDEKMRFRCHTGHAFTAKYLANGMKQAEERSLWVALRVMEERVRMLRRLAKDDDKRGGESAARRIFADRALEAEEHVKSLRNLLSASAARTDLSAALELDTAP